jgi:hypothetical protein
MHVVSYVTAAIVFLDSALFFRTNFVFFSPLLRRGRLLVLLKLLLKIGEYFLRFYFFLNLNNAFTYFAYT